MAFDPRWQPPLLQIQPPLNPSHQQQFHYNLPIQNPRSEATATIPAMVAVARQSFHYSQGPSVANPEQFPVHEAVAAGTQQQQYYYYQQGAAANSYSTTGFPSAGQYRDRGELVPEIPSIASIPVAPLHKSKSKRRLKKAKAVQPLHCAVCKIYCDTQEVLNCHKQGKQHKKNLQRLKDAITPKPKEVQSILNESNNNEPENKEPEKNEPEKKEPEKNESEQNEPEHIPEGWNKAQPVHCKVCDVFCNTVEFLKLHEAGKKHFKMVAKLKAAAETNTKEVKETKPYVVAQPAYCQICNILCTRQEDLEIHYKGKSHRKRAEIQEFYNLNPEGIQLVMSNNENSNQTKRKAAEINLTKKKLKVIGCDGGPIESKIHCDVCNIEVNSQVVYASHLAGSKHAAKVKMLHQLQVGHGVQQPVTAVADGENTQH